MKRFTNRAFAPLVLIYLAAGGCGPASADADLDVSPLELTPLADDVGWRANGGAPGGTGAVGGVGSLDVANAGGGRATLALTRVVVDGRPAGDFAETRVEHVFHSDAETRTEGTFRFPLPEGAIFTGLALEIDGKLVDGELAEREKAARVYEDVVDSMQDPALVEWDQGNVFKLRVFPIDPGADKRVVLTYLSPLRRGAEGAEYAFHVAAPAMSRAPLAFRLTWDGKPVVDAPALATARDVVVPVTSAVHVVSRETRDDGVYTAVRVRPSFPAAAGARRGDARPRHVVIVVDTSRSMLEERALVLDALRLTLERLAPDDTYRLLAADIDVRELSSGATTATAEHVRAALDAVEAIEPEGASDLGAALVRAATLAKESRGVAAELVYIGDGSPTWGETQPAALARAAADALSGVPVHAALLGKNADQATLATIAGASGGLLRTPRSLAEATAFAEDVARARSTPGLFGVRLAAGPKDDIYPNEPRTLLDGDELVAVIHTPKGEPPPATLRLTAQAGGTRARPVGETVALGAFVTAPHVAQRWAAARIGALEASAAPPKDEIVKLSLGFGVMSRHTSFLVLESDEAYAKYDIERKAQRAGASEHAPRVTGGDLESLASNVARLDPDHLQPGDPEVRIDAPANARGVVVLLPSGETLVAAYERDLRAWTVRFLVDKDTPDGTYEVTVRITHADGSVEAQHLHYVVDTARPSLDVAVRPRGSRRGGFDIVARQVITEIEIARAVPPHERTGTLAEQRVRFAARLTDARRVEVRAPDGTVFPLVATRLGEFRGVWRPTTRPEGPVVLQVIAFDRARNVSTRDVVARVR